MILLPWIRIRIHQILWIRIRIQSLRINITGWTIVHVKWKATFLAFFYLFWSWNTYTARFKIMVNWWCDTGWYCWLSSTSSTGASPATGLVTECPRYCVNFRMKNACPNNSIHFFSLLNFVCSVYPLLQAYKILVSIHQLLYKGSIRVFHLALFYRQCVLVTRRSIN